MPSVLSDCLPLLPNLDRWTELEGIGTLFFQGPPDIDGPSSHLQYACLFSLCIIAGDSPFKGPTRFVSR